jgi:hypothetical protein
MANQTVKSSVRENLFIGSEISRLYLSLNAGRGLLLLILVMGREQLYAIFCYMVEVLNKVCRRAMQWKLESGLKERTEIAMHLFSGYWTAYERLTVASSEPSTVLLLRLILAHRATMHLRPVISHQQSAISHQPSSISHQPLVNSHQPSTERGPPNLSIGVW